jgi:hypothetical protein
LKTDPGPDTNISSMVTAINDVTNWENEKYRKYGIWKKWPIKNLYIQKKRLELGQITQAQFEERRKLFLGEQSAS